jgi:hypothetical protein
VKRLAAVLALATLAGCETARPSDPPLELFEWERGLAVRARGDTPMAMYLWFWEWSLFETQERGDVSAARHDWPREVAPDGRSGSVSAEGFALRARVVDDGVELELAVENRSDHDWPEEAAIIACFSPGPEDSRTFEMGHHLKTYLVGEHGLERFQDRAMHFNAALLPRLRERSPELHFDFSNRWASSPRSSHAGLLLRESLSGGWTSGVAWEEWVAVQAHNPWLCMHVATKVGPLARGASKTVRGKLFLFPGDRAEGLKRFHRAF